MEEPRLADGFDRGPVAGWMPNYGTSTYPGDHTRGGYAPASARNLHSASGSSFEYAGAVTFDELLAWPLP